MIFLIPAVVEGGWFVDSATIFATSSPIILKLVFVEVAGGWRTWLEGGQQMSLRSTSRRGVPNRAEEGEARAFVCKQ
jgi:hypothetical protein